MRELFSIFSNYLLGQHDLSSADIIFNHIQDNVGLGKKHGLIQDANRLSAGEKSLTDYMNLRENECWVLEDIARHLPAITLTTAETTSLASYFQKLSSSITPHEPTFLDDETYIRLANQIKSAPLPASAEELETLLAIRHILEKIEETFSSR